MHIVTMQTPTVSLAYSHIRPISDKWSSDAPTTSFHETNLPVDTRHKVTYIHDMYFSHICHFRPMTQPNPIKTQIFDPFPTQPNPTRGSTQPMDNSDSYLQLVLYLSRTSIWYILQAMHQITRVWCVVAAAAVAVNSDLGLLCVTFSIYRVLRVVIMPRIHYKC